MKGLLIVCMLLTSLFVQKENRITITPDKKVYRQGETITFKVKATKRFYLATNGACSSSVLPPQYFKEIDGKFPMPNAMIQMCCGLPCSMTASKNYAFTCMETLTPGRWKVMLSTCDYTAGAVESGVFEVLE